MYSKSYAEKKIVTCDLKKKVWRPPKELLFSLSWVERAGPGLRSAGGGRGWQRGTHPLTRLLGSAVGSEVNAMNGRVSRPQGVVPVPGGDSQSCRAVGLAARGRTPCVGLLGEPPADVSTRSVGEQLQMKKGWQVVCGPEEGRAWLLTGHSH